MEQRIINIQESNKWADWFHLQGCCSFSWAPWFLPSKLQKPGKSLVSDVDLLAMIRDTEGIRTRQKSWWSNPREKEKGVRKEWEVKDESKPYISGTSWSWLLFYELKMIMALDQKNQAIKKTFGYWLQAGTENVECMIFVVAHLHLVQQKELEKCKHALEIFDCLRQITVWVRTIQFS